MEDFLDKHLIQESKSPCVVPTLLVPKKDEIMWMCVDMEAINKITVKYRFPISMREDMFDKLQGSNVFSKLDLHSAYHHIQIRKRMNGRQLLRLKKGCTSGLSSHSICAILPAPS